VELLDELRIERDDEVVATFGARYWERMLALLALHVARPVPRKELATMLWPYLSWDRARNRVSYELGFLRDELTRLGLPDDSLLVSRTALRLKPTFGTDIKRFEDLVVSGLVEPDSHRQLSLLSEARDMYGQGLLPIIDGEWVESERRRLAMLHTQAVDAILDVARDTAGVVLAPRPTQNSESALAVADARLNAELVDFARDAADGLGSPQRTEWMQRVAMRVSGLTFAIEQAIANGDRESALVLSGGPWKYLYNKGRVDEGRRYVDSALDIPGDASHEATTIALNAAGALAGAAGDYDRAEECYREALEQHIATGDRVGEATATGNLGNVAHRAGRHDESRRLYLSAIDIAESDGDDESLLYYLRGLVALETECERYEEAEGFLQRRLATARRRGDVLAEAQSLSQLASIAIGAHDYLKALELAERATVIFRSEDDLLGAAFSLRLLAHAKRHCGSLADALQDASDAVTISMASGHESDIGDSLIELSAVHWELGDESEALRLRSEAVSVLETGGYAARAADAAESIRVWRSEQTTD
jgi:tetratricopeptide (TPR) repeat protein